MHPALAAGARGGVLRGSNDPPAVPIRREREPPDQSSSSSSTTTTTMTSQRGGSNAPEVAALIMASSFDPSVTELTRALSDAALNASPQAQHRSVTAPSETLSFVKEEVDTKANSPPTSKLAQVLQMKKKRAQEMASAAAQQQDNQAFAMGLGLGLGSDSIHSSTHHGLGIGMGGTTGLPNDPSQGFRCTVYFPHLPHAPEEGE